MYVEWRRLQSGGLTRLRTRRVPLYERTRTFKVYCSNFMPGFLQDPSYIAALDPGQPPEAGDFIALGGYWWFITETNGPVITMKGGMRRASFLVHHTVDGEPYAGETPGS